jgi:predicted alpha/beta-hydrolase family hydrolase
VTPLILLAPGAGLPSSSPWMTAWAARLSTLGVVVKLDYPYQKAGRKRPDRHEVLLAAHRAALEAARAQHPDRPVVLAGKSLGSRMSCHLSLEEPVAAVVCFGYPLIGRSGARRDEVLRAMTTPTLFVQGTRDPLCPLADLAEVRAAMKAPTVLYVVETGDHSLLVTQAEARRRSQQDHDDEVRAAVARFLGSALSGMLPAPEGP